MQKLDTANGPSYLKFAEMLAQKFMANRNCYIIIKGSILANS